MKATTTEKPRNKVNKKIDVRKAVILKAKGVSYNSIAKQMSVNTSAVYRSIDPIFKLIKSDDNLKEYRNKEIDLIDSVRMIHLENAVNPKNIKKTNAYQSSTIFCQLTDKSQLIQGKATANININDHIRYTSDQLKSANEALHIVLDQINEDKVLTVDDKDK